MYAFNPSLRRQRSIDLCEFKVTLVYIVLSQTDLHSETQTTSPKDPELCFHYHTHKIHHKKIKVELGMPPSRWSACLAFVRLWVPFPALYKPRRVVHTCNPSTWQVLAGRSGVQGYPQLHSEFKASLDNMNPCLRKSTLTWMGI